MAITKLLRIKEATGRDPGVRLKKNLNYICDLAKTEDGRWIGGNAGMDAGDAYQRMKRNKEYYQKENGSQAFHYILSFPPEEEVDVSLAAIITEEFCRELLGDDYLYVYAIHTDKHHLHGHITFDAVSRTSGLKFHSPKGDWEKRIQPITDRLCRKYHLSTLDYEERKQEPKAGRTHSEWEQKKQPREDGTNVRVYNWYDIIRDDVDEAILHADSFETFLSYLKETLGYELRDGKHLSLLPEGRKQAVRTERLGAGYTREEISDRIRARLSAPMIQERIVTYGDRIYIRNCILRKRKKQGNGWKLAPYQKAFFRKWNNTYFIRRPEYRSMAGKHREDICKIHKLAEQLNYMITYDIRDAEALQLRMEEIRQEKRMAQAQYRSAKTRLYCQEPYSLVVQLEDIEKEISKYPKDSRQDIQAKREDLQTRIKQYGSMETCRMEELELKNLMEGYHAATKSCTAEQKILKRIATENLNRPYLVFSKKEQKQMQHFEKKADRGSYQRITIHEKLFQEVDELEEKAVTRIPFHKNEYLEIPMDDCRLMADGKILSAYIYDEEAYRIVDVQGKLLGEKKGTEVAGYYEIRKIKRSSMLEER